LSGYNRWFIFLAKSSYGFEGFPSSHGCLVLDGFQPFMAGKQTLPLLL